jgi:hypothetical protein
MKSLINIVFIISIPFILTCGGSSTEPTVNNDPPDNNEPPATTCQILVTNPNQSTYWIGEESGTIRWDTTGTCGSNVKLELYKATIKYCDISLSAPNNGIFNWNVETCGATSDFDYRVKVTDLDSGVRDYSENFKILVNDTCMLKILSINSSSVFSVADHTTISWDILGNNCGDNVKIELFKADVLACEIVPSTPNTGSFGWDVFHCGPTDNDYSIKITNLGTGAFTISEQFTINALF